MIKINPTEREKAPGWQQRDWGCVSCLDHCFLITQSCWKRSNLPALCLCSVFNTFVFSFSLTTKSFFLLCHHIRKAFFFSQRNLTVSIVLPSFVLWQTPLSDLINVKKIMTFTSSTASHLNPCVQPFLYFPATEHPGLFSHRQHVFNFSSGVCLLDTCWRRQATTASWRHGIWGGSTIPSQFRNAVWAMKSTGHWMHRGFWSPRTTASWCKKACLYFFVTTLNLTHRNLHFSVYIVSLLFVSKVWKISWTVVNQNEQILKSTWVQH